MTRLFSMFLWAVLLAGCAKLSQSTPYPHRTMDLQKFYADAELPAATDPPPESGPGPLVTISVKEMPLTEFLRVLAARTGVSVIWAEGLDKRLVSVEAQDVPVEDIFSGLSRRLCVTVQRVGSSWYVGEFRSEDRATLVRKALRLSQEDLSNAVSVVLGADGRQKCFKDGLIVVTDRAENCRRIAAALDEIESTRSDSWVVQLYLFSCSHDASQSMGFDTSALIDLSYSFAKRSLAPSPATGAHLASTFRAVMQATASREDVLLIGKPLFVLGDGEKSSFVSGVAVPVPKKAVSDQGTVSTQGFDTVQSGLSADVSVREGGHGMVQLSVHISLGEITGYVETAPIQAKSEFSTNAVLASSGVYLLGALDQDGATLTSSGLTQRLLLKHTRDAKKSQIQIWARLYRIAAPISSPRIEPVAFAAPQSKQTSMDSLPSPAGSANKAEVVKLEAASRN